MMEMEHVITATGRDIGHVAKSEDSNKPDERQ